MHLYAMSRFITACLLLLTINGALAQSSKKRQTSKKSEKSTQQPSSLEPYYPKENYEPKRKKATGKVTYDARKNFYKRMEEVAKAERKAEKELSKPQYSDPMYFGHKRPPKKRPPHKMKYCKVCGIRH
jgi:DNA segregation ATPase FtsK/SpoIIIE-like protein